MLWPGDDGPAGPAAAAATPAWSSAMLNKPLGCNSIFHTTIILQRSFVPRIPHSQAELHRCAACETLELR
jgi:hypothetical protein